MTSDCVLFKLDEISIYSMLSQIVSLDERDNNDAVYYLFQAFTDNFVIQYNSSRKFQLSPKHYSEPFQKTSYFATSSVCIS
jgi:hypothetical protein